MGETDPCQQELDCVRGVCRRYFSSKEGDNCQADIFASSCAAGYVCAFVGCGSRPHPWCAFRLYCNPSDNKCLRVQGAGIKCTSDAGCSVGTTCACDTNAGDAICVSLARTQQQIDAQDAYVACAQRNQADDNVRAYPGNLIGTKCLKEYVGVVEALFGDGCSSPASRPSVSFALVLIAALAVWLLA